MFERFFINMVQNGPVESSKNMAYYKKYTHCIMIIFCQGDIKQHREKLVRLLLYTTEKCSRPDHACVHLVPSQYTKG
jgi:hypothetical protein